MMNSGARNNTSLDRQAARAGLLSAIEGAMDVVDAANTNEPHLGQTLSGAFGLPSLQQSMTAAPPPVANTMQAYPSGNEFHPTATLHRTTSAPLANKDQLLLATLFQEQRRANQEHKQFLLQELVRSQQSSLTNQLMGSAQQGSVTPLLNTMMRQQQQISYDNFACASGAQQKSPVAVLRALGSNRRRPQDPYVDVSTYTENVAQPRVLRGGVQEPFPEKVLRMLTEVEAEGRSDIIGFYSHGRAFGIHEPEIFVKEILPRYCKQTKLNSFCRQLNLYGFSRIQSGPDAGGYYHELFLRGKPELVRYLRRVGVPTEGQDRRKSKPKQLERQDPDFYSMPPIKSG